MGVKGREKGQEPEGIVGEKCQGEMRPHVEKEVLLLEAFIIL
jgi:hypothetical protein